MSSQTYLVTGAGRGLGKGFVTTLLQRENTTVIAALRDPLSSTATALKDLIVAKGSNLVTVKIDSESDTDALEAVEKLSTEHGIESIDVVIANAAMVLPGAPTATTSVKEFRQLFQVNTMAPLLLFQATWPLLQQSLSPTFVGISSCLATLGKMEDWTWPMVAYGTTKAAMNYIVRKMHFENEKLVAFAVHPGWVQTDAGNRAAKAMGREEAPDTVESSVNFILGKIDASSKEYVSGTFQFLGSGEYYW